MLQGCSGVVPGCSGVFRGCSGDVPGCSEVFRGVPGCSGCVPGFTDTRKEQAELPSTEKEIEVAKRELRFVRQSTVNKLHQTMEKLKHFVEFRGSRTGMRLLLEQVFETREEIRTINFRFFALLEAAEQQREQTAAERLENEVEYLRQRIDEHLKERINEPPSSIASIPLSLRKVSAPKGIEFGKPAMSADMNINPADIETTKSEQADSF